MDKQNKKILTYILLFVGLFIGYFILRDSTWIGSKQLHTIMEVISSLLALLIGIMALLHFYSKKNSTFLFIGAGFLGTSFLDTYHAIVTSTFFDLYFPSPPDSLIPWSWVAARLFLSVLLWFSYLAWVQEQKLGKTMVISEKAVYIISALLAITCFFFFAFVPLPRAYYPELFFSRPEEFVPAIFFLLALIGYLKKGHWKTDEFEHWLVLSLIVGFMAQVMFMSFSEHLFDTMFDSAHLLKKVSYICVLVGLFINIYIVYKTSDKYTQKLTKTNHYFETVIEDMVRVSQGLAQGKLNVMPIANYHGEFAQIKTSLITALSNQSRVIEDITQVSQGLANGNLSVVPKAEYNGDFVKIKEALEMALTNQNQVIEDITQVSQGLAEGNLSVVPKAEYNGDFIKIKEALEMALTNQNQVIEDITQVSQGLANGDLNIVPRASYKGDFLQIQEALQMALFNLKLVIEDIVHVSQGLAKGENVITQAEYKGDFGQINDALETASSKLTTAMKENTVQDWIKSGQANLDELIRGEQDITTLAKNIIGFLCKYVNAQVGLFYLVKKDEEIPYLQIIAGYAYVDDKQRPNKYLLGEGLVGEVALEKKPLIFAQTIEECPNIIRSGLANAMPRNLILLPCLYESKVKAVIEIGLQAKVSDTQYKFLEQVMSGIGIAINTADSRAKMQVILEQSQQQSEELQQKQQEMQDTNHKLRSQSEELQSQQEELQTQQEELRQTNEVLGERTSSLERQKGEIQNKNKALEQTKSEMQTAQEAILTKAKELELASKYKSEFLANMSHELRTPLNSLLILSQLLSENKKGNLDDKQVEYAKTMYSAGNDLLTLINDILDLSKVEAGKVEINWEDIDLSDLFNTIKQKFQPIAEDKNLGFDLTIATNIPTTIIADGQRIKQIVNNLLSNAFKFTNKGQIQILIERPTKVPINLGGHNLELNKTIAISVIDSGIGIPKNKQQVVFEAFQQADGSTSRKFGGTGLGLSISRQLTRLMGGELILTSEEAKGSTFSLFLPEKEPDKVQSPTLTVSKPAIPSSNSTELLDDSVPDDRNSLKIKDKSLLIIEDDRNFSSIVMELAHDKKFKCLLAEDGITGLKLAEEYTPKAIILDINLPKMDGWTVMEKLKDNPDTRHIPVHFMSADDKMMDAKKLGAIGYLLKPSNVEGLQQAFSQIEGFLDKTVKNLLIVTDIDAHHQEIINLLAGDGIEIQQVSSIEKAFETFKQQRHDCIVLDLDVEKGTGSQLLAKMCENNTHCQSPVIIYANRDLTTEENILLNSCANEMPLKSVHSFERLLDEVTLFLHQIAADLPSEKRDILQMIHNKTEIFHNKKVLLVDDDTRNSFALTTVLEDYDMEVIVAVNGKDALEKLAKHDDIAIVLMDIMMPEMDGYEAMKKIRQQSKYRKLPIIALTAKAMKEDKIKCIEAGANDYLAKPINTDKLLSLMRVWLYR